MDAAIELKDVTKRFGETAAVDHLNLEVPRGAICGFIGPNGAGKTTTIRLILSILFPNSGAISVLGRKSALEAKNRIGYLPEERGVYKRMRVGDFLRFLAGLKGLRDEGLGGRIRSWLERVDLRFTERMRCEELSKGMLQKVQLLAAVIHEPDLLILDEPFSGLDPVSMRTLKDVVLDQNRRGATILFSTHVMTQAEELCQHIVMINRGRKVLDERLAAIRTQYDTRVLEFDPLDPGADVSAVAALPGVDRVDRSEPGYKIVLAEGTDCREAMHQVIRCCQPARLEVSRPRLEDVFVRLVSAKPAQTSGKALS